MLISQFYKYLFFFLIIIVFTLLLPTGNAEKLGVFSYSITPSNGAATADQTPLIVFDIEAPSHTVKTVSLRINGQAVNGVYEQNEQKYVYDSPEKLPPGEYTVEFKYTFKGYMPDTIASTFRVLDNPVDPFKDMNQNAQDQIEAAGVQKLNEFRKALGLTLFSQNESLQKAAQAHSNYLNKNAKNTGHYEIAGSPGFTGLDIGERTTYFGYHGVTIGEGIAYDKPNAVLAVDNLMDAPYHRLSIVNPNYSDIGVGFNYTNGGINGVVVNYGGHSIKDDEMIAYPYNGQADAKIGWFVAEEPNPLRSYGLDEIFVGYPISLSVHDRNTKELVTKTAIITDHNNKELESYLIDSSKETNDLTHVFLIPKEPLTPGETYHVNISATRVTSSNERINVEKSWSFSTLPQLELEHLNMISLKGDEYLDVVIANGDVADLTYRIEKDGKTYQTFNENGNRYYRLQKKITNGNYHLEIKSKHFDHPLVVAVTVKGEAGKRKVTWSDSRQNRQEKHVDIYPKRENVSPQKKWTIRFNAKVNEESVRPENVYVVDENGQRVDLDLSVGEGGRAIIISAPKKGYQKGKKYELNILNTIRSKNGIKMKKTTKMAFTIQAE